MSWQRFEIDIPKGYKPDERKAIAQEVIDFIIERSKKGKDKNNRDFPKYSDVYKKSLDFKIAGKSGSKIDLTLSGEMLDSISLLNESSGRVVIGFEKGDSDLNAKAEGNILGSYGGDPNPRKARDFLGIAKNDLKKILEKYPIQESEERSSRVNLLKAATKVGSKIFNSVDLEEE